MATSGHRLKVAGTGLRRRHRGTLILLIDSHVDGICQRWEIGQPSDTIRRSGSLSDRKKRLVTNPNRTEHSNPSDPNGGAMGQPVDEAQRRESSDPPSGSFQPLDPPDIGMIAERARLLRQLRTFFDDRGFLEVQPPCLSRHCIVDPYIDPIDVARDKLGVSVDLPPHLYLQTSPEASLKRMLAAGAPSIYSMGPVFRAGESGPDHNTEFTMLEWYDVGADLRRGVDLLGSLAAEVLQSDSFDVVTYRELFVEAIGVDPLDCPIDRLAEQVSRIDKELAASLREDRDALLDVLLSEVVQPTLGHKRPLVVRNYPISQAALARESPDDERCAARFELFANGMELANGYDELRDSDELTKRFRKADQRRIDAGRPPLGEHAMRLARVISEGIPACAGVALGVDRLLMVRTGSTSIRKVIPFSIDLA